MVSPTRLKLMPELSNTSQKKRAIAPPRHTVPMPRAPRFLIAWSMMIVYEI